MEKLIFVVFLLLCVCLGDFVQSQFVLTDDTYPEPRDRRFRPRRQQIKARIIQGAVFVKVGAEFFETLPDNSTVCRHRGNTYAHGDRLIDNRSCRLCRCFAPTFIICAKIHMSPLNIPDSCVALDPARTSSRIPRFGICTVPIVERSSPNRPCRDWEFQRSLAGKRWSLSRENPEEFAVSVQPKKSNVKRGTRKNMRAELSRWLRMVKNVRI